MRKVRTYSIRPSKALGSSLIDVPRWCTSCSYSADRKIARDRAVRLVSSSGLALYDEQTRYLIQAINKHLGAGVLQSRRRVDPAGVADRQDASPAGALQQLERTRILAALSPPRS